MEHDSTQLWIVVNYDRAGHELKQSKPMIYPEALRAWEKKNKSPARYALRRYDKAAA